MTLAVYMRASGDDIKAVTKLRPRREERGQGLLGGRIIEATARLPRLRTSWHFAQKPVTDAQLAV